MPKKRAKVQLFREIRKILGKKMYFFGKSAKKSILQAVAGVGVTQSYDLSQQRSHIKR